MQVLSVASEAYPLVKTGGLADVVGALPLALAAHGVHVRMLLPGYPAVLRALGSTIEVARFEDGALLAGSSAGLDVLVLDAPTLFSRAGHPYLAADGRDWQDNAQRFAALARAGAAIALGAVPNWRPDLVHAHDWQAGLVPAYLALAPAPPRPPPPTVFTVHNMAFGGLFPASLLGPLHLPAAAYAVEGLEFYGQISFLKAGLHFARHVTTVSPTYAREILTPEGGMGFDGVLQARAATVSGILNGIDTDVWDPARDALLPSRYDADDLGGRTLCKAALQDRMGLAPARAAPLFGVISRLTTQKGLDLLPPLLAGLSQAGGQLALLGSGDAGLEAAFLDEAAAQPGAIGVRIGYDESLAHLIQAGADALLVPSRFEPCGLTQLCALRYGAVPVVARVGGLADTVIDANEAAMAAGVATGVQFLPVTQDALGEAIRRVMTLYRDAAAWNRVQRNGMTSDVSWAAPARRYARLFADLVGHA